MSIMSSSEAGNLVDCSLLSVLHVDVDSIGAGIETS